MQRLQVSNKEAILIQIKNYFETHKDAKFIRRLHGVLLL